MSSEAIAAIIASVITGLFALIAARWDELVSIFQPNSRPITGTWQGESYMLDKGAIDPTADEQARPPDIKYTSVIKQKGSRVAGTMVMTQTLPGLKSYEHDYKGRIIKGEYFTYEMNATKKEQFRVSTALLHINNSGDIIKGYYVANGGRKDTAKITVGFTIMRKEK
jgi:hypothetical protein